MALFTIVKLYDMMQRKQESDSHFNFDFAFYIHVKFYHNNNEHILMQTNVM